jgi:hypothetical protein
MGLVILAWRITALGVAGVQIGYLDGKGEAAARQVLDWYPGQAAALARLGIATAPLDVAAAERLLTDAYRYNLTDSQPLMELARLALARGDTVRADALSERVDGLRPVDPVVQWQLGRYWSSRGDPARTLRHWSRSLEASPDARAAGFPALRALLKNPSSHSAFRSLLTDPPGWWEDFFADTAQGQTDLELVRRFYQLRNESFGAPLSPREHRVWFERLMREQSFEEAYAAWVDGLTTAQRRHLGLVFDGGFELPLSGFGFDWHSTQLSRVEVGPARPEGEERQALRLRFRLLRLPYEHLYQPLLLVPGAYEVAGSFRSQDLMTDGGFRWMVRCRVPDQALLGESERLFPVETWTPFKFEIEVPDSCLLQEFRLISVDVVGPEGTATDGELWFDDLSIRALDSLSPLGRARIESRRLELRDTKRK